MKNLLFSCLMLMFCVSLSAQTLSEFHGSINTFAASGTDPNFEITGFFNHSAAKYTSDQVQVGDVVWDNEGRQFEITNIIGSAGGIINADVIALDDVTGFTTGLGIITRNSAKLSLPMYVGNIPNNIQSDVRTHMTLKIDTEAGTGDGKITDALNALVIQSDTTVVLGGTQDRNTTIEGDGFYFTIRDGLVFEGDSVWKVITNRGNDGNIITDRIINKVSTNKSDTGTFTQGTIGAGNYASLVESTIYTRTPPPGGEIDEFTPFQAFVFTAQGGVVNVLADSIIDLRVGYFERDTALGKTGIFLGRDMASNWTPVESNGRALSLDDNNEIVVVEAGSAGAGIFRYTSNEAIITATGAGVTFALAAGTGTFTVPAGVEILSARISGETADLVGDALTIVFDHDPGYAFNQAYASINMPNVQIINTASLAGGGPGPALPFVHSEATTPQIQTIGVGSGDLTCRVINLNSFSTWQLTLQF